MPRICGIETYKKLQEINPDLNVIFTSGAKWEKNCEKFCHPEGTYFMQKPFKKNELEEKIAMFKN
jgi:DNA-binding NtrC family response regulator